MSFIFASFFVSVLIVNTAAFGAPEGIPRMPLSGPGAATFTATVHTVQRLRTCAQSMDTAGRGYSV